MSSPRTPGTQRRSRKGCPECRRRKVKCDEQKPECGQCLRTGRACRIIDGLFRPHSYSFLTPSSRRMHHAPDRESRSAQSARRPETPDRHAPPQHKATPLLQDALVADVPAAQRSPGRTASPSSLVRSGDRDADISAPGVLEYRSGMVAYEGESRSDLAAQSAPVTLEPPAEPSPQAFISPRFPIEHDGAADQPSPHDICVLANTQEDDYQDRCEISFFLRCFSEGPGRWMDVCADQPYFSQQVVFLSARSALFRYAAAALAAKQLGYMKNPEALIRQTRSHKLMTKAFADSNLDFLWYGAKYYEKSILILAQQLSHEDHSVCQLSPRGIYQTGLTPDNTEFSIGPDSTVSTLQVLAACILCQYEDISATMRAYSGHLNGIHKLLRPYLRDTVASPAALQLSWPKQTMEAVYWFFALNDMLDAYVNKRKTRLDFRNAPLWRKMGLPLDDSGHLMIDYLSETNIENTLFRALIQLMCQLISSDLSDPVQWNEANEAFDRWQAMLPSAFSSAISWPPFKDADNVQEHLPESFSPETWFPSDMCALSMAFYHMARMLLLIHRPVELFLRQSRTQADLLTVYQSLHQSLRQHAMEIIPIARGASSGAVRKYMLQPLYVAGRSLSDSGDRQELLDILREIDEDLGVFTDYRQRDLSEEWGIPYESVEKNIVP